jgi:hypothetical protein
MTDDRIRIYPWATDTMGCFYQRLKMPLDALERLHGDEFEVCWTCEPRAPGVVLGQRIMGHGGTGDERWLAYCRDPSMLAVYEIDDDVLDIDPESPDSYHIWAPHREGTLRNIAWADHVIAATRTLAAKVLRFTDGTVSVAPNCVEKVLAPRGRPRVPVTIGWGGSWFHEQDFPPSLIDQLRGVAEVHPDVRWTSMGADYLRRVDPKASFFGFGTVQQYHDRLTFIDIGIAPLRRTRFNASRSWIRALDYMANGVVPVVEGWGQYPELLAFSGRTGAIVEEPSDWFSVLSSAIAEVRDGYFSNGSIHDRASEYLIDRQVHRWADVFRRARDL